MTDGGLPQINSVRSTTVMGIALEKREALAPAACARARVQSRPRQAPYRGRVDDREMNPSQTQMRR